MVDKDVVLDLHKKAQGKTEVTSKVNLDTPEQLSTYYTPGVSYVSQAIADDVYKVYDYTSKSNTIAIISDGTRILGLGDIGPYAGLPVMEGKAILFKKFGGVDAVPICVDTKDEEEIIQLVKNISPTFGGINIEDIESPKSFRIAERLEKELDIPVFHDDRQGTGVVVLAALMNALKVVGKKKDVRIMVNGAGSAGVGIVSQLVHSGFKNITVFDKVGAINKERKDLNDFKQDIAKNTNPENKSGNLEDLVKGADVIIGASSKGAFKREFIGLMNERPIVFALANPYPEITYEEAKEAGAYVVATGSSDKPNQVNNLLAFPGIMRGLLDSRAKRINYEMLYNAAVEIAKAAGRKLGPDHVISSTLNRDFALRTVPKIAAIVADTAVKTGEARIILTHDQARQRATMLIKRYNGLEKRINRYLV